MKSWDVLFCTKVTSKNELSLKGAVFQQPVTAMIDSKVLKKYTGGVYRPKNFSSCK